jgi:hypothetical protein
MRIMWQFRFIHVDESYIITSSYTLNIFTANISPVSECLAIFTEEQAPCPILFPIIRSENVTSICCQSKFLVWHGHEVWQQEIFDKYYEKILH